MDRVSQSQPPLPAHLQPFIAREPVRYTPRDHAVWRFLLRQLAARLSHSAHPVYREGLAATGIDLEGIPAIADIDRCLQRFGWRAVAVDGFIPPAVFMEFQSRRVLPIAQAMRRIEHMLYTPAPDIVHEAAGHAPFLIDDDYAAFLQRFGEVGLRAESSEEDLALYRAVRRLSILKESTWTPEEEMAEAERELARCVEAAAEPSPAALLSRLHWWTVEYGLIGDVRSYRLFGAGLLSSLGECVNCRDDARVRKLPLSLAAIQYPYDITREQPQLFVARSFAHLGEVLEQFAARLPASVGAVPAVAMPGEPEQGGGDASTQAAELMAFYRAVRERRESDAVDQRWLMECDQRLAEFPTEWLLRLELLELQPPPALQRRWNAQLRLLRGLSPMHQRLIDYGLDPQRAA